MQNFKLAIRQFGFCSIARSDDPTKDAVIGSELQMHAKQAGLQYERGLMCHSLFPPFKALTWTDEKLQQPRKRR